MGRYDEDTVMSMSAELDNVMLEIVCHMMEPCPCEDFWKAKFEEAVDSQRQLQEHVHVLLRRLEEADFRCLKAREEAALNSQALKKQVAETQRLAAECKSLTLDCESLTQECSRLENECHLYHNDREVFMEAADEAEERAAQAEESADVANRRVEELLQELESCRDYTSAVFPSSTQNVIMQNVPALRKRVTELEIQFHKLQDEAVRSCLDVDTKEGHDLLKEQNSHLSEVIQWYEVTKAELKRLQGAFSTMEKARDEMIVSNMVSSAISAGVVKALEQDRDEAVSSLNLQFKAILKRMQGEFRSSRERLLKKWTEGEGGRDRMKAAEKGLRSLLMEVDALRQEIVIYKGNLEKAQDKIHMLAEENEALRLLLKVKCNSCLEYRGVRFITSLHAWH
ncbi:uncharacterized protein [Physcomitrium patens]|uniref:uncharacterized protein isoform X3 n=1 Tax=Physcomitrium patens TaxID=3218 RepID=UPI000D150B40|nr:tropomyosin beta chain-like isoform X3 [Physcomitrium patens]|eukprot:XP_024392129.1 tropomyosin beta chain-like isoform X3 [Physcomitrella patens]